MKINLPQMAAVVGVVLISASPLLFVLGQIDDTPDSIEAVDWSPDGRSIAIGGGESGCGEDQREHYNVTILDSTTEDVLIRLSSHRCRIISVAWSPDGARLASASVDGWAIVWDIGSETILSRIGLTRGRGSLSWNPDGTQLANVIVQQGIYDVFDAATGEMLKYFEGHDGYTSSVDWSPDGTKLASGGSDNVIRVWDANTANLLEIFEGHADLITEVTWSPDGAKLASASWDGAIRIWDAETQEVLHVLLGRQIVDIVWHPSGTGIASAGLDGKIHIWDTDRGEVLGIIESEVGPVLSLDWSPDGTQLVYVGNYTGNQGENLRIVSAPESLVTTASD